MKNKKKERIPVSSLLFVCYGNICRSPMAEGIAKKKYGDKIRIESAGIAASEDKATWEAIEAMKSLFNMDISRHHPRHIADVNPHEFDLVIALDHFIYNKLLAYYQIPSPKLLYWEIEDPISQSLELYKRIALKIEKLFLKTLHEWSICTPYKPKGLKNSDNR